MRGNPRMPDFFNVLNIFWASRNCFMSRLTSCTSVPAPPDVNGGPLGVGASYTNNATVTLPLDTGWAAPGLGIAFDYVTIDGYVVSAGAAVPVN